MKFLHIADVHLGMEPDKGCVWSENRGKEIYDTFYQTVNLCEKQSVDILLIAGDLFHRQPLVRELKELNYAFGQLSITKVVLMAGNHDFAGARSHYRDFCWNSNVYFLSWNEVDEVYFEDINTKVYGFSYAKRDITESRYDYLQPKDSTCINILLAHGGDEKNVPFDKNKLINSGFDYVALGHIHKPAVLSEKVRYAGSLEPLDVNEVGEHGCIIGEIDSSHQFKANFLSLAKRTYIHLCIEVSPEMTFREIQECAAEQIERSGTQNIFKVELLGPKDIDLICNTEAIYALGYVVRVEDNMIPDYDFASMYYENRDNMIGMFIDAIRKENVEDDVADMALYYGIEALTKAGTK